MSEADSYVNIQVGVHAVTPLTNPDNEIISLASGLAASIYNYWQTPAKDRTLEGIKEWKNSIAEHIKGFYGQKDRSGTSGDSFTSTRGVTGTET